MTAPVVMIDEATLRRILAEEIAKAIGPLKPTALPMMGAAELAQLLRVNVRTLRRMALAGDVPAGTRIGGKTLRWDRRVVSRWLESGGQDLSIRRRRA